MRALSIRGNVSDSTEAQKLFVATAQDIPTSTFRQHSTYLDFQKQRRVLEKDERTSMTQRKHLSRVRKRHRSFTRRVEGVEEVDEQRDEPEVGAAALGDPEAEACRHQGPAHVGEGEEEEGAAAEGVDCPDGGPGAGEC